MKNRPHIGVLLEAMLLEIIYVCFLGVLDQKRVKKAQKQTLNDLVWYGMVWLGQVVILG